MFDICRKARGAISVFMSVIILSVTVFGCVIVDGTRLFSSKSIISNAGDLAMNAALANYEYALKEMYGLFGMKDVSSADLEKYFENTLNAYTIENTEETNSYGGFIQLDSLFFQLQGVNGSQVCQPEVMTQQILEYSKYRVPLAVGEEILEKLGSLTEKINVSKAIQSQIEVSLKMNEIHEICKELKAKLDEHNVYCSQKPSDSQVSEIESEIKESYRIISKMLMIESAISYGILENVSEGMNTEEKMKKVVELLTNIEISDPESCFETIMEAWAYNKTISSDEITNMLNQATEDKKSELETLHQDYKEKVSKYTVYEYRNAINQIIDANIIAVYNMLNSYVDIVSGATQTAQEAIAIVERLEEKLNSSELGDAMKEWEANIAQLSGEEKVQQEKQYNAYKDIIENEAVGNLKECLNDNIEYVQKLDAYIRSFEFCEVILVENADPYFSYKSMSEKSYVEAPYTKEQVEIKGNTFFNNHFTHWNYEETTTGMLWHNMNEHPYFKKLEELFNSENENVNLGNANEKIKDNLDSDLLDWIGILDKMMNGLPNGDWSGNIPSKWLKMEETKESNQGSINTEGKNEDFASSSNESIEQATSLLSQLSVALTEVLERLYITEYGIEMFSYFTVDKCVNPTTKEDEMKDAKDIVSLSGFQFSEDSTALYKSEVEYLLWGEEESKVNVTNTMLTVFAIRFLLNCIFAFTNTVLANQASSIAACTNFAAPLVQVALLLSIALIETAKDMQWLMLGKSVVIFKDKNTWSTDLFGFFHGDSSRANEFTKMSYKDYIRVFLLINTVTQEKQILARMADCIQLNLRKNSSQDEPALDLTQSYTMVAVKAEVATKTSFMHLAQKLIGKNASENANEYTIYYKSVLAY